MQTLVHVIPVDDNGSGSNDDDDDDDDSKKWCNRIQWLSVKNFCLLSLYQSVLEFIAQTYGTKKNHLLEIYLLPTIF